MRVVSKAVGMYLIFTRVIKLLIGVMVMATSTAVHSNAFNFMSYLQGGVDPRTGQYTVSLSLPELKANGLAGPVVPLTLLFNPLNVRDSGFGIGWSLQLSEFDITRQILSLSSGETFKVTGAGLGGRMNMQEQKLDSFHAYDEGTQYRVAYKSGVTEILSVVSGVDKGALPTQVYSLEGRWVKLAYTSFNGNPMLQSIEDEAGQTLLSIERVGNDISINLYPYSLEGEPLSVFTLSHRPQSLESDFILPTDDKASWRFRYTAVRDFNCISQVETPTGAHEKIEYTDAGHRHPAPTAKNLPRVTRHTVDPGFDQPIIETEYSYVLPEATNEHNFLGFGSGLIWTDDGLDNLYKVTGAYDYGSVERLLIAGKEARRIERTFNRFHLLTKENTIKNEAQKIIKTTYHESESLDIPFDAQPSIVQLPLQVDTLWSKGGITRLESVRTEYDAYGNLTEQQGADGVIERTTYYPAEGVKDFCPPDPEGFVRYMGSKRVNPAEKSEEGAQTLRIDYRYGSYKALSSESADWISVEREVLVDIQASKELELQVTEYQYHKDSADRLSYGRLEKETASYVSREGATLKLQTAYTYSSKVARFGRAGETILLTTEVATTEFDSTTKTITREMSLIHGQPLLERDDNDVEVRYSYDALGRVLTETVAPETEYEASRVYEYQLSPAVGIQATQTSTNVKGVKTRTLLDGLNRVVGEERQNADATDLKRVDDFRPIYEAAYDVFGSLLNETEFDWLDDAEALTLRSSFVYDDWDQQCTEIRPDGVKVHEVTDPIGTGDWAGVIVTSWFEVPGSLELFDRSVTWMNTFNKPVRTERFDKAGETSLSVHEYGYDGLGRAVREVNALKRETLYTYDAFDRMISSTLPGGAVVERTYAEHSSEDLPTQISVNHKVLGTQAFDGLGRMAESITGGRIKSFVYQGGSLRPSCVTTAAGENINYEYLPSLSEEPVRRVVPASTANYSYDKFNGRLLNCDEQGQSLARTYFSTGEVNTETVSTGGAAGLTMTYTYSLRGRLLAYTDVIGQEQVYKYDGVGRLASTVLGSTQSTFTYTALGQTESISTVDSVSKQAVILTLSYDEHGREVSRLFDLDGVEQTLVQVYDAVDNLTSRTLSQGDVTLRKEVYSYDVRGRLEVYECSGSQPPVDSFGGEIETQVFIFDAMDNMTEVDTFYTDGESNVSNYYYESPDPVQLTRVTNSFVGAPAEITLDYDLDGNLVSDEVGRTLAYDELGRLINVSA